MAQRVLDEGHLKRVRAWQVVYGQTHAVDGHRTVRHHKLEQPRRESKVDEPGVALLPCGQHLGDAVHMTLHEMAAQTITQPERALEVHARPSTPALDRR